jgi:hypothetical protein
MLVVGERIEELRTNLSNGPSQANAPSPSLVISPSCSKGYNRRHFEWSPFRCSSSAGFRHALRNH